jgi:hypothetical protein
MTEFQGFPEITRLAQNVTITEKIHGTNAQVRIEESPSGTVVLAGSRTRWLTPEDDNYGFARWVQDNREGLVGTLGPGTHFGEWFGSGINSGYGYTNGRKRLALFNTHRWAGLLPEGADLTVVPVLYSGPWRPGVVEEAMAQLREGGSRISNGRFDKPEGVVVRFDRAGALFKQVFEAEETGWKDMRRDRPPEPDVDRAAVLALYQPVRLEKLLSRDERWLREYPRSLPGIVGAYVADMEKEAQFEGVDERAVRSAKRGLFSWVKDWMSERGYKA